MMHIPVHNQDPGEGQLLSYPGHWPLGEGRGQTPWACLQGHVLWVATSWVPRGRVGWKLVGPMKVWVTADPGS